jgi:quercetin dioxygenase-like cupin family protein
MQPVIIQPGEGKEVNAFGDTVLFKIVGAQTGNGITIGLATVPPGGGPPLHLHRREDEIFISVSGDLEVNVLGEWKKAPPGSVVFLPRDVPHQFRNAGSTTSQHWVIATPSGFESFFEKCSAVFAAGGPPDFERILAICAEHGAEIVGPPPGGPH